MSLHGYIEDEINVGDDNNITLISRLDESNPLHLHLNDSVALTVSVKLKGTKNYQVWSCALLLASEGKNKTGFIDGSCKRNSVLSRETLPDVRSAYAIISREESYTVSSGNDRGHFQDVDASASKSESFAALEKNNSSFEGNVFHDHSQEGINQVNNDVTNLKRSFRPSIFPRNFNNFVVDSKVKYEASQHKHWVDAMNAKMDALYRNNTWELTALPVKRKAIGSKWVFKIKYKSDSKIERFEARLVAKSFNHMEGIEFDETFSPVVKIVTIRRLINLDVQSVYVNDIIIIGNSLPEINKVKQFLKTNFMIKDLGKLKYFLRIEILDTSNGVFLNQRKYFLELIDEFGLLIGKPSYISMQPNISLTNDPSETDPLLKNFTEYQKLIGNLIYLTTTRPDIAYTVYCLSQFMHSPFKSHLKTALKVIKYLKGSPGKGINVIKGPASGIDLKAYPDADWARCTDIRRSITAYCVFMCGSMMSWKSKKTKHYFKIIHESRA
uniref:Uncharacterized protein n=1 Tax=Tanacetum cinerariifolium TaxID=118510 RepID=A0A6L2KU14_TANCI|nr:hypothetical protein [Tanacetum cinerariifolium]